MRIEYTKKISLFKKFPSTKFTLYINPNEIEVLKAENPDIWERIREIIYSLSEKA